jgi:hypothetical protein
LESGNFIPSIAFEDLLDCFGQKIISIRMPVTSDYYQINAPEYFGKTVLIDTSGYFWAACREVKRGCAGSSSP